MIKPIAEGTADYCKGNRFYDLRMLSEMPLIRLIGNTGLSFLSKFSTEYWDLVDPTNGFIAIHAKVLQELPLDRLSKRFFFETDILFRLYTIRAKVVELPMRAKYADEVSNLSVRRSVIYFFQHCKRIIKRIFYNYFLRDFNIASINLLAGFCLFIGSRFLREPDLQLESKAPELFNSDFYEIYNALHMQVSPPPYSK